MVTLTGKVLVEALRKRTWALTAEELQLVHGTQPGQEGNTGKMTGGFDQEVLPGYAGMPPSGATGVVSP